MEIDAYHSLHQPKYIFWSGSPFTVRKFSRRIFRQSAMLSLLCPRYKEWKKIAAPSSTLPVKLRNWPNTIVPFSSFLPSSLFLHPFHHLFLLFAPFASTFSRTKEKDPVYFFARILANALIYETGSKLVLPFERIKKKKRWERTSRTRSIALILYAKISIMRVELIGYPLDTQGNAALILTFNLKARSFRYDSADFIVTRC